MPFLVHFLVTFQARMLEWVTISFSRGSSQPRDQTHIFCIGRWVLYHWATWESAVIIKQWLTIHKKDPHIFPLRGVLPRFQLRLGGHGKWRHWTQSKRVRTDCGTFCGLCTGLSAYPAKLRSMEQNISKEMNCFFPDLKKKKKLKSCCFFFFHLINARIHEILNT